jgi:predicted CXXCH cytochrome family protein
MSRCLQFVVLGCVGLLVSLGALLLALPAEAAMATTKHNLSVSGPGTLKAASESQTCVFCHAPHNATPNTALWNRRNPGSTYTPYTSSTTRGNPGQPTGASLLCLSCHDGTIALGEVLSRPTPITMSGGVTTIPAGVGRLGTDLSDDHPVSFAYTAALAAANGELVNPATLTGRVRLDASGQMQCTACHDPHDDTNGKFLVMSNQASALCQACHVKNYWAQSNHKLSTKTWSGAGPNPWPHTSGLTVADNACENCHRPHSAGGAKWLLNNANEESNCYTCHNANVATKNVQSEFNKLSIHPVAATTGVHDAAEPAVVQSRHVECVDCHNPHANNATTGTLSGSLLGVRGIDINGSAVNPSTSEYQICLRCHGDSTNKPAPRTTRQIAQTNTRLEFQTSNPSFHPVAGVGKNTNVPSLIAPWTINSTMGCGDCHNNNAGPGAGGVGPKGPHGSTFPSLLERQYVTTDNTPESAAAYAICYKCHSRANIAQNVGTQSFGPGGKGHQRHLGPDINATCNVCHDPHGVSGAQGNTLNNSKLINFDTTLVKPTAGGLLKYESLGPNRGRCYLVCHAPGGGGTSHNHNPENYP